MAHHHAHGGHHHHHQPDEGALLGRSFKIAVLLNILIVIFQVVYGVIAHSLALLSDAGHNLTDVLGLLFSWIAFSISRRLPTKRRTYGLRRSTILASLLNGSILLAASGGILWEAVSRFRNPQPVHGDTVMWVAGIAMVLNAASAFLFMKKREHDLNVKSAFLHLATDALVSLGVVISGFIIAETGILWIDPLLSILIVITIGYSTWGLFKESLDLALDAVPSSIDTEKVETYLRNINGVVEVHDLHIWGMSTTEAILTTHLVIPEREADDNFFTEVSRALHDQFGIEHATIQVEKGNGPVCHLAPNEVV